MPRLSEASCTTARQIRPEFSMRLPRWSATWRQWCGPGLGGCHVLRSWNHDRRPVLSCATRSRRQHTGASQGLPQFPAAEFQSEITKLAQHGRVLVLLDACRSAGLIGALPAAEVLKSALAASNVTVLTSSKADKLSREDEKWRHGAFTKVLLDALSGSADDIDTDRNGVISMAELTAYIAKHLIAVDRRRSATRARSALPGRHLRSGVVGQ